MADNTVLPTGGGGDTIRDIDRSLNPVSVTGKTQIVHLDCGGQLGPEVLVTATNPLPVLVVTASYEYLIAQATMQALNIANANANGFYPLEIPGFLTGVN